MSSVSGTIYPARNASVPMLRNLVEVGGPDPVIRHKMRELRKRHRGRVLALFASWGVSAAMLRGATLIAWLVVPVPALAQDNIVATATLPRDLSPWGMYLNADLVVRRY